MISFFIIYDTVQVSERNGIKEECGKKFWGRDVIFENQDISSKILFEGKIYGFSYNITEKDFGKVSHGMENVVVLSNNSFMYKHLLTSGRVGRVFIPLIPVTNEAGKVVSFMYPSYFQDEIEKFPSIETINNRTTIIILDLYNFILSYFGGMDYLTILSYCKNWGTSKIISAENLLKYDGPINSSLKEKNRGDIFQWIDCRLSGTWICVIPLIILVPYYNAMHLTCGIPMHIQKFFDRQLKVDKFGVISKNGYFFGVTKNSVHDKNVHSMQQLFIGKLYLTDDSKNSNIVKMYRSQCDEKMESLKKQL